MVFKKNTALNIEKSGRKKCAFTTIKLNAARRPWYTRNRKGHFEGIFPIRKAFSSFISSKAQGVWFIEEKPHNVEAAMSSLFRPIRKVLFTREN